MNLVSRGGFIQKDVVYLHLPERHTESRFLFKKLVATATNYVHFAIARLRSLGQGAGTWISEELQMNLIYRGQKYYQQKATGTS